MNLLLVLRYLVSRHFELMDLSHELIVATPSNESPCGLGVANLSRGRSMDSPLYLILQWSP